MNSLADPWREYRKRRNLALIAFLGYVPVIAILAVASDAMFHTATPAFVLALLWMVAAAVAGNWFIRFKCPRCGEPFFANSRWMGYNTMARRCLHCKLPLNSPDWQHASSVPDQRKSRWEGKHPSKIGVVGDSTTNASGMRSLWRRGNVFRWYYGLPMTTPAPS